VSASEQYLTVTDGGHLFVSASEQYLTDTAGGHLLVSTSEQYLTATAGGHLFLTRYLLHRFRRSQSCSGQQAIEKLVIEISSDSVSVS
jgi:hypothetical protein